MNACRIACWTGIVAASLRICCMVEWPENGLDYFPDRNHDLLIINSSCSHSCTRTVGRYIYNNRSIIIMIDYNGRCIRAATSLLFDERGYGA